MTLEPYYSDDHVTIYHGETLRVLQQLPDEPDAPGSAAAVTATARRWSTDGRLMPERYRVATTGPVLCDEVRPEQCGGRWAYEQRGCRGEACRDTQREMGRRRRRS